jgi:hypothetical protein
MNSLGKLNYKNMAFKSRNINWKNCHPLARHGFVSLRKDLIEVLQ